MKLTKLPSLLFLIIFFIASCGTPPSGQGGNNSNADIEIQMTGTESIELGTETISQPNCTGVAEVENTIEKSRTIQYVIEVQNGASVNANGQVGFAGTDVELGATIASQFGQSYGTSETLTRSITVKAKPETSMQHVIRQVEIWKVGQATISVGGQQKIIPFKFRSDFAIELVDSQNIYPNGCNSLPAPTASQPQQSGNSGNSSTSNDPRDIAAKTLGYANLDDFMRAFGIPDEVKPRIFVCPGEETWCLSVFEEPGKSDFHFKNVSSCTIDGKQANGTSTIPEGFDGMIKGFTIRPCR